MSTQIEGGNWYQECQQLRAQLAEAQRERDGALADVETYSRYAEKFGDLSCCYDAEDVTAVIDRKLEDLTNQLQSQAAQLAGMREGVEIARKSSAVQEHVFNSIERSVNNFAGSGEWVKLDIKQWEKLVRRAHKVLSGEDNDGKQ